MEKYINKITAGDCFQLLRQLPDNSIDAVITDPPYSSGGRTIAEKCRKPSEKYEQRSKKFVHRLDFAGDNKDARSWLHWCILWISECHRVLKVGGYFLMFSDWRQLPLASDALQFGDLAWRGIVAWDKGNGSRAPHKGYFRHQCEYIVWGTKGGCPKATHAGPFPGCMHFSVKQKDKFHLTGKPTLLMEELVSIVPGNGIILDPFAGSGTTLVAARNKGKRFIGFEKLDAYAQIGKERLGIG